MKIVLNKLVYLILQLLINSNLRPAGNTMLFFGNFYLETA